MGKHFIVGFQDATFECIASRMAISVRLEPVKQIAAEMIVTVDCCHYYVRYDLNDDTNGGEDGKQPRLECRGQQKPGSSKSRP